MVIRWLSLLCWVVIKCCAKDEKCSLLNVVLIDSRSTGVSYVTSTRVPPLKSRPRLKPRKVSDKTEIEKIIIETMPAIFLYFIN